VRLIDIARLVAWVRATGDWPALGLVLLIALWPARASAYRPFDGTDADVAELYELELEIGPVGYYSRAGSHDFVSGGVLNFGFAHRFELVLQGFDYLPLDGSGALDKFTDTGVFVKSVLREGCLQEKAGPSVATEIGPLLPTVNDSDSHGVGAYVGGILTSCFGRSLIVHFNMEAQLLRANQLDNHDFDLFVGAILEPPPSHYVVRPVVELFTERDFELEIMTFSGLVGVIWQVNHKLALDAAFREASIGEQAVSEVRAGFSWAIP
jgi:hypothetical protein